MVTGVCISDSVCTGRHNKISIIHTQSQHFYSLLCHRIYTYFPINRLIVAFYVNCGGCVQLGFTVVDCVILEML